MLNSENAAIISPRTRSPSAGPIRWITLVLCAFVFLDIAIFTHVARILLSDDESAPLEIRNPYIGLDELYYYQLVNSSVHNPIMNKPRRIAHVFSNDPQRPSPIDEHRGITSFGMMTPPDQHLRVSRDVSLYAISKACT